MAHKRKQGGFTIVETMIAVSVFSVMILIAMVVVIGLGRAYEYAAAKAKMLDASRQVHALFQQSVAYGADMSPSVDQLDSNSITYNVWCAGTTRFVWYTSSGSTVSSYTIDPPNSSYGSLYSDTVSGPQTCTTTPFNVTTAEHLLPEMGFVTGFDVDVNTAGGYATLTTRFNAGTADMFEGNDVGNNCQSSTIAGLQFCSVVNYESTAVRKVTN